MLIGLVNAIALSLANYDTQIVIHYSKSFAAKKLKIELENLGSTVYIFKSDLKILDKAQKIISLSK